MNTTFKFIRNTVKNWYIPLIVGIIFVLTALYTFFQPMESYLALSIIFAFSFLISGSFETIFAISNSKELENWGWTLLFGLVNLTIGFILLSNPAISMVTLPLYVGFVILFRSISAISYSLDLKNYGVADWGTLLLIGIFGILFSLLMIFNPVFGGMNIVIWTGMAFLFSGIYSIYLSLKLRKLKNAPKKISQELKQKWDSLQAEMKDAWDKKD